MKRLLFITVLLSLISCQRFEYGEIETFTIKAGEYYSDFPIYHKDGRSVFAEVMFDESCKYDSTSDCGWHKLVGLMPGINDVHKHSARIAWRNRDEQILLSAYRYELGKEGYQVEQIFYVPFAVWFEISVVYFEDPPSNAEADQAWRVTVVYGEDEFVGWYPCEKFDQKNFFWLGPYFGGECTAPHDMKIYFKFRTG